jgi:6-phosphogluconolactonase
MMIRRALARGLGAQAQIIALEDAAAVAALPDFEIALLGAGVDGHFASLFPGAQGLAAAMDPCGPAPIAALTPDPLPPEAPYPRLTLTLARLIRSRRVALMITGAQKREIALEACAPGDLLVPPLRGLFAAAHVEVHWSP